MDKKKIKAGINWSEEYKNSPAYGRILCFSQKILQCSFLLGCFYVAFKVFFPLYKSLMIAFWVFFHCVKA